MSLPPMAMPPPAPADLARRVAAGHGAAHHQADAEDGQQQALGGVARDAAAQRRHVAADDVAGLVGDDADHLVGRLGLHEGAGVDEHVAAVDHEGVEAVVPDDAHGDVLRAEAGGLEDRQRVVLEQVLDLGVADQRQALRRGRRDGGERGRYGIDGGQRRPRATSARAAAPASAAGPAACRRDTAAGRDLLVLARCETRVRSALSAQLSLAGSQRLTRCHGLGNSNRPDYKPHARARQSTLPRSGREPARPAARRCGRVGRNHGGLRACGDGVRP